MATEYTVTGFVGLNLLGLRCPAEHPSAKPFFNVKSTINVSGFVIHRTIITDGDVAMSEVTDRMFTPPKPLNGCERDKIIAAITKFSQELMNG